MNNSVLFVMSARAVRYIVLPNLVRPIGLVSQTLTDRGGSCLAHSISSLRNDRVKM
jgi:hypothetical protein